MCDVTMPPFYQRSVLMCIVGATSLALADTVRLSQAAGWTALGDDIAQAQQKAYRGVDQIHWQGAFHRRDIGWRAIARDSQS